MALRPQERERGLAALNEARQARRRSIVLGRVRIREVATGFWITTFVGLLIFGIAYDRYKLVELKARRGEVLARQKAVAAALGTEGTVLRDRLEAWVMELAAGMPEQVAPEAELEAIQAGPTIYVRLPLSEARDVPSIREAAARSVRDGFTSCLFIGRALRPDVGGACSLTSQCGPGEVCSDWNICAAPAHPYNMRLLYEGLRVLEPAWLAALEIANDKFELRALELDLEDVAKHEAVAAAELVRRSRYFTVLLDEAPEATSAPPAPVQGETPEEQLQATDHAVRVGIWDIQRGAALAVLRVEAAGRFVRLGAPANVDAEVQRAQQRQVNNCAAATRVREAIGAGRPMAADSEAPALGAVAPRVSD